MRHNKKGLNNTMVICEVESASTLLLMGGATNTYEPLPRDAIGNHFTRDSRRKKLPVVTLSFAIAPVVENDGQHDGMDLQSMHI
jgi:hypothetical protein